MARKQTLDAIISLYKKLGGNTSEVLGTKTNVNFLGKGKSPELMLDMDINADALGVLPRSKAVEELTSSVGYAVSGKLNDIQASQLLKNMQTMDSVYFPPAAPANITDLQTGIRNLDQEGLMSLRAEEKLADDLVKNVSDAEAEATFIAMTNAIRPSIMDNNDIRKQAVWLIDGYKPTEAARGVFAAAKMNTTPYPMLPYAGLMHSAIGKEISDFMQGKETAKKTLSDIEDAYKASAKEKGFL